MKSKIIILLMCSVYFSSCVITGQITSSKEKLKSLLEAQAEKGKILFGHQDAYLYGHSWKLEDKARSYEKSDIKDVCGVYPAVYGMDLGGIELDKPFNIDNNLFEDMRRSALAHYKRGGVVTFSWHPRNPLTMGDSWDISSKETVASILPGGEKHELFRNWLSKVGDFLSSIRTDDGDILPVIFRPWHENTGSWFWWGKDLCTPEQYRALWKMTYEHLNKESRLRNLVWAYSPGASGLSYEVLMERYPGDNMVDIVGFDCYQYDSKELYISDMQKALELINDFAKERNKFIAVTETGYESVKDKEWWTGTLYPIIENYPLSYVLVWRNACDKQEHFYAPYPGQESAEDFKAFSKIKKMGFL